MIATYRLQLVPGFGFPEVARLAPYFRRLGVSHLYLSPVTEARKGSFHGYDVIDHNAVRAELGGREEFERMREAVCGEGLELILDFVPNHASVGARNEAWQDVLAYGKDSEFARYFDIDWSPLEESLRDKVLLPFLGRPYGEALDAGEISLVWERGGLHASYCDRRFALSPLSYPVVLNRVLEQYERKDIYFDVKDLCRAYETLSAGEVQRAEMLRRRLLSLEVDWPAVLAEFRGSQLHAVLERQNWRLAYWKVAGYEINYRRFFDINELVALRMEDDEVFWHTHRLLGELMAEDGVAGVRIDHVDGLFDPQGYLRRLREIGARQVWVEKILAPGEALPEGWAIEGTTGYEFLNSVMSVLVDRTGWAAMVKTYQGFVADRSSFREVCRESKLLAMETSLSSELQRLAHQLNLLCKSDYHTRDFALGGLREALAELIAALDRYRTYLPFERDSARGVVEQAVARARRRTPAFEPAIYEFIVELLLRDSLADAPSPAQAWVARFQQYTAPVAAKGVEDTAFYRYLPLVALNEVGGEPAMREHPMAEFHAGAQHRAVRYPLNLLATATHDHKRGEDTRMRLIALSELASAWEQVLRTLENLAKPHLGEHGPSRHDQYLFFQTLTALWHGAARDELAARLAEYMRKASRESKRDTSWNSPYGDYERDLERFVRGVLGDPGLPGVIDSLAGAVAERGFDHSLTQIVLKFTSPGVPDIYQGCELADLSLVDPDNRRPVDYERRQGLVGEWEPVVARPDLEQVRRVVEQRREEAKFYFTARLLRLRSEAPELFRSGGYQRLEASGADGRSWIAFARILEGAAVVVLVPRCSAAPVKQLRVALPEALRGRHWIEELTGTPVAGAEEIAGAGLPLRWAVLRGVERGD